jgi:hypothetical protein
VFFVKPGTSHISNYDSEFQFNYSLTKMNKKRKEELMASMDQVQNYKLSLAKMEFYNPAEHREGLVF